MDKVIFMLEMNVGDLALIYQLSRNDKLSVNEWIMKCVLEKIERIQEEWMIKQKIKPEIQPQGDEGKTSGKKKGGEG